MCPRNNYLSLGNQKPKKPKKTQKNPKDASDTTTEHTSICSNLRMLCCLILFKNKRIQDTHRRHTTTQQHNTTQHTFVLKMSCIEIFILTGDTPNNIKQYQTIPNNTKHTI